MNLKLSWLFGFLMLVVLLFRSNAASLPQKRHRLMKKVTEFTYNMPLVSEINFVNGDKLEKYLQKEMNHQLRADRLEEE